MPFVGAPLPAHLLAWTVADGELVPAWLSDRDRPWLRDLLAQARAAAGQPLGALAQRWARSEPDPRAGRRFGIAAHVVLAALRAAAPRPAAPGALRAALFAAAATADAATVFERAAAEQGLPVATLRAQLFADLPEQREVPALRLDASAVLLAANQALAQGLLRHAVAARLALRGHSRAILRTAWLQGQGLRVVHCDAGHAVLDWRPTAAATGRAPRDRTRAVRAILPLLPWAEYFALRAVLRLPGTTGELVLASGDPLPPGPEPREFDSGLEARFAAEFRAAAPDYRLLREPLPVATAAGLAFPDFGLQTPSGATWLLELAGLRDPAALPQKLLLLEVPNCLVALPARVVPPTYADHPRLVPFATRLAPAAVLAAIDRNARQR